MPRIDGWTALACNLLWLALCAFLVVVIVLWRYRADLRRAWRTIQTESMANAVHDAVQEEALEQQFADVDRSLADARREIARSRDGDSTERKP